jgi:hypothetical protein
MKWRFATCNETKSRCPSVAKMSIVVFWVWRHVVLKVVADLSEACIVSIFSRNLQYADASGLLFCNLILRTQEKTSEE